MTKVSQRLISRDAGSDLDWLLGRSAQGYVPELTDPIS